MTAHDPAEDITIPKWFLSDVAPRIREISELQVMLAFFRKQADSVDYSDPVSEASLLRDESLREALKYEGAVQPPDDTIRRGIELAVARDSLLQFEVDSEHGVPITWVLLATPENRVKLERYRSGTIPLPVDPELGAAIGPVERSRPGVFRLYEQNIGLVTPIIADRLVEALELYPQSWIEDAIAAAVSYNRRNWRYIQRILETWATEGRSNETNRRHQSSTGDLDPDRHLTGEYAAIFRRRQRG
jgi:DNA replication protein